MHQLQSLLVRHELLESCRPQHAVLLSLHRLADVIRALPASLEFGCQLWQLDDGAGHLPQAALLAGREELGGVDFEQLVRIGPDGFGLGRKYPTCSRDLYCVIVWY